ncbi:hypothetical protein NQ318_020094 [Aromia moschata]|uniref:Uncharacterized protein n=1 Tax=Aromia moschata TaxID=1265417 RepID=A0AAV8Z9B6_9CUCU|nr:hypothetical protein NQ318_020094 [Aromia moschata]
MFSLLNAIRKVVPLSVALAKKKWPGHVRRHKFYKPLLWLTPCAAISPSPVATEITQYDVEENITQLVILARIAIEKGDLERAEAILEMGIHVSEEYHSYATLPYMYDILSSISFTTGNLKKAELLLVRIVEKMTQLGIPEDDTQLIDFKLRLARIHSFHGKRELAEVGFKSCLADQESKILGGDTSTKTGILYVNVLLWYALHKIKEKDYRRGKDLIDCARSYSMKIRGLTPYQEMLILYTLGDLNVHLGEHDVALQSLQSAVLIGKGIGSLNLPKYYLKLGKIYLKLGSKGIAGKWANEAQKLAEVLNDKEVAEEAEKMLVELE